LTASYRSTGFSLQKAAQHMSAISTASLSRNVLWNFTGQVAPLFAAVFSIPLLIKGMGLDRFGLLTLAWMVIGYFSLFDFGLGRALIKLVSEKLGEGRSAQIPELIWTALFLMAFLGIAGGVLMFVLCGWLVTGALKIPAALQGEALGAFRLLAWSIPIVILTTGFRGILEAYRRFDLVNIVRLPLGVLTFIAPLGVLPFSRRLDVVVLVLLAVRLLICVIQAALCERVMPGLWRKISFSSHLVGPMLGFGGWMTVTNIVSPVMVYMDRFFIGSVLGLAAVAYYVTPYEIITKLLVIPGALVGVLFPMFSASLAGDRAQATELFRRSVRWVFLALYPLVLVTTIFADDGLRLWLSVDFSGNGAAVLQWLAAGVLINSLAFIPFAFVQGAGRPDLTAKLHLAELPIYLLLLWLFMHQWGIVGAAAAWTLRVAIDAAALFTLSLWFDGELKSFIKRDSVILALALVVLAVGCLPSGLPTKLVFTAVVLTSFSFVAWHRLLSGDERRRFATVLRRA
jgi:O-antigen/teichoic acid export membrane protein